MSGNSSRKPSGSSTYSVTRSPLGSPNHVCLRSCPSTPLTLFQGHSQRSLNPAAATNMYVVGMGNTNGRNGLNSGWQVRLMYFSHYILNSYFFLVFQVWGSATPASKKKTSVSSATSAGDLLPHQNDPNYLGGLGEGWASSRPASGSWSDEVNEANFSHMVRLRSKFHRIV